MKSSKPQFETVEAIEANSQSTPPLTASKKLHPEDISIGDAVAVSETVYQYISFSWCGIDTTRLPPEEVVKVPCLSNDANPLIVKSVCLPYVLCEQHNGKHSVVDVRLNQLVRLDKNFADSVRKELEANESSSDSKTKSKKKRKRKRKKRSK